MPGCAVPFCNSGQPKTVAKNKEDGIENPTLFTPKSDAQLRKWEKAIQRGDRSLKMNDAVCSLHFDAELIASHNEILMPDGSTYSCKRKKPTLKDDGAVPSIFPKYPKYLLIPKKKERRCRKSFSTERGAVPNVNNSGSTVNTSITSNAGSLITEPDDGVSDVNNSSGTINTSTSNTGSRIYHEIMEGLSTRLSKEAPLWEHCISERLQCTYFLRFTDEHRVLKKIILRKKDSSVLVLFGNVEVSLDAAQQVQSADDFLKLIRAVETMKPCPQSVSADPSSRDSCCWKFFNGPNRRLWFISDFPHLIKNVRNWVIDTSKRLEFQTPDGTVKLSHWEELLKAESNPFALQSVSYKFTEKHLRPRRYEKMNVALAYHFFDEKVASAMELYKERPELRDCEASRSFILRIRRLITAMSSRTPKGALRSSAASVEKDDIQDFLDFLTAWESMFPTKLGRQCSFLTDSTSYGLRVTLTATLEIFDYLTRKRSYNYLMTARLNQDNLERFFGMIRSAGGNDDHPDSVKFAYIYRLMSAYSLLKPPRGSNISEGESFATFHQLMKDNTILGHEVDPLSAHEKLLIQLDSAVSRGQVDFSGHVECEMPADFITEYVAGYVARQSKKFTQKCQCCTTSLLGEVSSTTSLIAQRDKFNVLVKPSPNLFRLLKTLEKIITEEITDIADIAADTFFLISNKIDEEHCCLPLVGCSEHSDRLTISIINFYLIMRMNFICRSARKALASKSKTKSLKKQARL